MTEYEKRRLKTIEENRKKMEEFGINTLTYETMCLMKKKQGASKMVSKKFFSKDDEYKPNEEVELNQSSEDTDNEITENRRILRSCMKKVMADGGRHLAISVEKPQNSTSSMANLFKMRSQTHKNKEVQKKGETQIELNSLQLKEKEKFLTSHGQQEQSQKNGGVTSKGKMERTGSMATEKGLVLQSGQENLLASNIGTKKRETKSWIAPGSITAYARMKEKSREMERLSNQTNSLPDQPIHQRNSLSFDMPIGISQKQRKSYSDIQLYDGDGRCRLDLVDESEGFEPSYDYAFGEERHVDLEETQNDGLNITTEVITLEDQENNKLEPQKQKRKRGPSRCKAVYAWPKDYRSPIILNGSGQPIGPDKDTLDTFSRFLGSIARDSRLAPPNNLSWHKVSNKDTIWDYVKAKFVVAEEGKDYVLQSVGALWRVHKSRTKSDHYSKYDNDSDRWTNKPDAIPDGQFMDLLEYWNLEEVQKISEENRKRRESQDDRHTLGPVTFARRRHQMEQAEQKPISDADLYTATRKRTSGRKYKTSYEPIEQKIDRMKQNQIGKDASANRKLVGRCAKRQKKPSKSNILIPDEFMIPYKAKVVTDTVATVMKIFKEQLSPEILAPVALIFGDPLRVSEFANNLINGQSSGELNNIDECQDNGDEGTNHGVIEGLLDKEKDLEDY